MVTISQFNNQTQKTKYQTRYEVIDHHVHTLLCNYAESTVCEYVQIENQIHSVC